MKKYKIKLFEDRPDLLQHPPVLVKLKGGRWALRWEAARIPATEMDVEQPRVVLYFNCPPGEPIFGYSFHYSDGLVEEWTGPHGDPSRDANQAHGFS